MYFHEKVKNLRKRKKALYLRGFNCSNLSGWEGVAVDQ